MEDKNVNYPVSELENSYLSYIRNDTLTKLSEKFDVQIEQSHISIGFIYKSIQNRDKVFTAAGRIFRSSCYSAQFIRKQ